jgi:UDP-N-acetylmuramoyl-L-alanyl-D-glutamate--2,6-diaminopimelate ligase
MRLDALIAAEPAGEAAGVEITGLAYDSREVAPGDLFFCVSGFSSDGHAFAPDAVRAGAGALVVERSLDLGVPEVVVSSARAAMAPRTNGKTTTAYLVQALLEAVGEQCGLLGTVKSVIGGEERQVARTTPEAIDLQEDLRAMLDGGDVACAMEVSSHALELGRTDAIGFAVAIFTNLTQDHLDFHASMEDYFQAKRRLFLPPADAERPAFSVVNVGDQYGRRLAAEIEGALTFAVDAPADYSASAL